MKFEIELPRAGLPTDREVTGIRWVKPKSGDYWLTEAGAWELTGHNWTGACKLVADLAPVKVWRPATVEDAILASRGDTVRCRGWDWNVNDKMEGTLTGLIPCDAFPWGVKTPHGPNCYTNCEVLDTCK